MVTFHRLHPNDPESWRLWPNLEERVVRFCAESATDTNGPMYVAWLRKMFVETPALLGAWVAQQDGAVIAHFVGWVETHFGEPLVYVHEAKVDLPYHLGDAVPDMVKELTTWVDECNWAYEQQKSTYRIRKLRWATDRTGWARYLERHLGTVQDIKTIMTWTVASP